MASADDTCRLRARVTGRVQGVGFRYYARRVATALALRGYVRNQPDGAVEIVAEGPRVALDQLLAELRRGPMGPLVRDIAVAWAPAEGGEGDFSIRH